MAPGPVRRLPATTHKFVCYFSELEHSGRRLSLWDRIAISLVLAGREESERDWQRPVS